MARTIKPPPDYAAALQQEFDRWEHLKTYGGSDPFWSDGSSMNLVRNHIIYEKRKIEENLSPEHYPQIYFRETPPEKEQDYMARADEIRVNAEKSLALYKADSDYQFLCGYVPRLTNRQKKDTSIDNVIGYAVGLEHAIKTDDLIAMRRHERTDGYIESFSRCAAHVRGLKPPDNEQMNLFADYTDDGEYNGSDDFENDDDWEDEY